MTRLKELLDRIRWHPDENPDICTVHYRDRVRGEVISIPFNRIEGIERGFMLVSSEDGTTMIPLHRVVEVRSGGEPIWTGRGRSDH